MGFHRHHNHQTPTMAEVRGFPAQPELTVVTVVTVPLSLQNPRQSLAKAAKVTVVTVKSPPSLFGRKGG